MNRPVTLRSATAQASSIKNIIAHYQTNEVKSIKLNAENLSIHKVFLTEKRYALHDHLGNKFEVWEGNERVEDFLLDLHHRFLLGNAIGLNIAGFSGLLLIPLMLVDLALWLPRRKTYRLGLFPRITNRSNMIRSHGNRGATLILPILALVITGVILSYPDESRQILLSSFISTSDQQEQIDKLTGVQHATWQRVLERVTKQYPQSKVRWVSPPSESYPYGTVGVQQLSAWNVSGQTMVYVDATSGTMDGNSNALLKPTFERVYRFSYLLHTGKFGLWYRLPISLLGIVLCVLTALGFISFLKR